MIKKTLKNTFQLIFRRHIIVEDKKYRLPYLYSFLKELLNVIYIMGGFLYLGANISILAQSLGISIAPWFVIFLTVLILLVVNILIVYFSPWIEKKDEKHDN